ncbi:MAG: carboxymuconolactone decarboxylase family protein [Thermoanaerobaculales bacterium]|jgi:AhpD family alkylhydroperoxidase|nr:carboxymuconolactone decarboxylase family protein [Thermoanaerobaculales bacterium]
MAHRTIDEFKAEREALTELTLAKANLEIKRFFNLDSQAYRDGALPARTKELLGLVASMVLRCDDCIFYHLDRCREEGVADEELQEAMSIALVVGGSIVIPHLRRAVRAWEELSGR